ncbi:hypothetical protein B0O80DRAFT_438349 [Mortierella sp. GBAus27b]|nr:hypothetical protein B0O80DRAFT_438349 [Mortierella sp. GBAus27b]
MLSMVLLLFMLHHLSMIHYMPYSSSFPHSFMLHSHTLLVRASLFLHDAVAYPSIVQCLSIEGLVKSNGSTTV